MHKKNFLALGIASLWALPAAAHAAHPTVTDSAPITRSSSFEAGLFTGYLAGTAREYVYYGNNGPKLSQLNWRIDNAATVGLNLAYRPVDWLTIRGQAWTVVASNGRMTDYDWTMRPLGIDDWTDRSISPLRRMNRTYGADLGVAARFHQSGNWSLDALAGVRYLTMKFKSYDGAGIYSSDDKNPGTFRDLAVQFHGPVINYKQTWRSAYLGAGMRYDNGKFGFHGQAIVSPWTFGKDRDDHLLRGTTFREHGKRSSMFGMELGADYRLAPRWTLYSTLGYEKYARAKADTHITGDEGNAFLPTGSAGLANETWNLRIGARLAF